ncbi:MAG: Yip1 family protein [Caulobacteraceae bacterium]
MSVVEGGPNPAGIIARAQGILLKPNEEWDKIAAEPATIQSLFVGYAAILAALPALTGLLGGLIFMHNIFAGLATALVGYALGLGAVFALGYIADALAPSFGAEKNLIQAMKLVVYSWTATWVAGILSFIPVLGGLISLVGFGYGCYLLYLGVPKVMKAPADKAVTYTVVIIVAGIVLYACIVGITAAVLGMVAAASIASAVAAAAAAS